MNYSKIPPIVIGIKKIRKLRKIQFEFKFDKSSPVSIASSFAESWRKTLVVNNATQVTQIQSLEIYGEV